MQPPLQQPFPQQMNGMAAMGGGQLQGTGLMNMNRVQNNTTRNSNSNSNRGGGGGGGAFDFL